MASRVLSADTVASWPALPSDAVAARTWLSRANWHSRTSSATAWRERLGPVVEALYPGTVDPPNHRRRLRDRLTWLLLRPGRLDRD